jgi:hypothetical protein
MLRLLDEGRCCASVGQPRLMVAVSYDQQWRTLWRAQREGYLDDGQMLTPKGIEYLRANGVEVEENA